MGKADVFKIEPASFRDPSGFVFWEEAVVYRQINQSYGAHYKKLQESGLYQELTEKKWLVSHQELPDFPLRSPAGFLVIKPEPITFISYPYEWSFSQLKDAALLTLKIQLQAMQKEMSLKDASAYNVQFQNGRPLFIDSLSFEPYHVGRPWVAYRQFCQHFLAPLALMALVDPRLNRLLAIHLDGIPLDLAASLLPGRARLRAGLAAHLFLHAKSQSRYADRPKPISQAKMSSLGLLGLLENLQKTIEGLRLSTQQSEWGNYPSSTNYSKGATQHKKELVEKWLQQIQPKTVCDLGANTGEYSRLAADQGAFTLSCDNDPLAVEKNYLVGHLQVLPLAIDLTNPSPALGWQTRERASFLDRVSVDLVLVLALIHHLAIANNIPLVSCAEFCAKLGNWLIIEFVPKDDTNAERLLVAREDIFPDYTQEGFEAAFTQFFQLEECQQIFESKRVLYLMQRKELS